MSMDPTSFNSSGEISSLTNAIIGISKSSSTIIIKTCEGYLILIKPNDQNSDLSDVMNNKLNVIHNTTLAIASGLKGDSRVLLEELQDLNISWTQRLGQNAPAYTLAKALARFTHSYTMNNSAARRPLAALLCICDLNEKKIHEINLDGSFKRVFVSCSGSDPHNLFLKIQREKLFTVSSPVQEVMDKLNEIAGNADVINSYVKREYILSKVRNLKGEFEDKGILQPELLDE